MKYKQIKTIEQWKRFVQSLGRGDLVEIIYEKGLKCEEHYLGAVVGRESRMIKTRYVVKVKEVSVGITVCYFPDTFSEKDDNEGYHNVFVRKI